MQIFIENFSCDETAKDPQSCCKVEAVVSIDERGQMVLPKEIREKAHIHTGDKLAVVLWEKEGFVCCITLMKVEELAGMVKNILGPLLKDMTEK
jgi:AbrB family looped-hinge helix DNA binding protein